MNFQSSYEEETMDGLCRTRTLVIGLALVVPFAAIVSTQPPELVVGKWKLNLAKSTYDPGPPPKSDIRTFEDRGGGVIVVTLEIVDAQGKTGFTQIAARYDGRDYPIATAGAPKVGTIAYTRIDQFRVDYVDKMDGKVTSKTVRTISKDGKTMTQETTGTTAQGRPLHNVLVFDRQ
jgi:hypothetical protein